jgi:succinoglycan biosynthesis protein ExoA
VSDNSLPNVTVIIAARPDQADIKAVVAARNLDYPDARLEIIVARGVQPSVQRNAAVKTARGDWLYFLDDDSVPPPGNLRAAAAYFSDPAVQMVGGPNLCPPDAPPLEQVFATVLSSWLAFGPSRARYLGVGPARATSEKELILCNLAARRGPLMELGGFNEALYPNEENALMDELQKRGGKLMYDPALYVYRRPRRTLRAFARMLRTYGRGRAEQFRLHPTLGSALNFAPPLFCVYLILLATAECITWTAWPWLPKVIIYPLWIYLGAVAAQTLWSMRDRGVVNSVLAMPLLVASHIFYGLGFWRGLITKLRPPGERPDAPVKLETVTRTIA